MGQAVACGQGGATARLTSNVFYDATEGRMVAPPRPTSESETPQLERAEAFAELALQPSADGNLVEIAYWCHVELVHASQLTEKERRARFATLNAARAALASPDGTVGAPARPPKLPVPRPRAPFWAMALSVAIAVAVPAGALALLRRETVSDQTTLIIGIGAAIFGLLLARAFWIRMPPVFPPVRLTEEQARGQIRLTAAAPPPLRLLSHQYLRRRALLAENYDSVRALDAAVGLLHNVPAAAGAPALAPVLTTSEQEAAAAATAAAAADPEQSAATVEQAAAGIVASTIAEDRDPPDAVGAGGPENAQSGPIASSEAAGATTGDAPIGPADATTPSGVDEASERPPLAIAGGGEADQRAGAGATAAAGIAAHAALVAAAPDGATGTSLLVLRGATRVNEVALENGRVYTIGSGRSADITLGDHSAPEQAPVATEHARLTVRRGRVLFHHVGEQFESKVNGVATEWAVIEPGDEIAIGDYTLRCEAGAA